MVILYFLDVKLGRPTLSLFIGVDAQESKIKRIEGKQVILTLNKNIQCNINVIHDYCHCFVNFYGFLSSSQDMTNEGVNWLCDYAQTIEQNRPTDRTQVCLCYVSDLQLIIMFCIYLCFIGIYLSRLCCT